MLFNKGAVLLLLTVASRSVDAFTTVAPTNGVSVAFAPRTNLCFDTALFSDIGESAIEEPAAAAVVEDLIPETIGDVAPVEETETVVEEETEVVAVDESLTDEPVAEEESAAPTEEIQVDPNEFKIYVGNMVFDYGPEKVEELFAPFGAVKEVQVPPNKYTAQYRGYAFVKMADREAGATAIEALNGKEIEGRTLKVIEQMSKEELDRTKSERKPRAKRERRKYDGTKIYCGNLPFDAEREEITAMFEPYGDVTDCFIPLDRDDGRPRGFAFITMPDDAAAAAIEALNGVEFGGRDIVVNESRPRGADGDGGAVSRRTRRQKLYVGNISFQTDEEELVALFEEYGEILDMYVPVDQDTGRPRGFAFVTMEADVAAQVLNECDGYELDGRILRVNEAQAKSRAPRRDDYYDNGGNGGGYNDDSYGGNDSWGEGDGY